MWYSPIFKQTPRRQTRASQHWYRPSSRFVQHCALPCRVLGRSKINRGRKTEDGKLRIESHIVSINVWRLNQPRRMNVARRVLYNCITTTNWGLNHQTMGIYHQNLANENFIGLVFLRQLTAGKICIWWDFGHQMRGQNPRCFLFTAWFWLVTRFEFLIRKSENRKLWP